MMLAAAAESGRTRHMILEPARLQRVLRLCDGVTPCLIPVDGAQGWTPCSWFVAATTSDQPAPEVPSAPRARPGGVHGLTYPEMDPGAHAPALTQKQAHTHPLAGT